MNESICIGCGCTDMHACDGGCSWLRVDRRKGLGVCSECPDVVKRYDKGERELSRKAKREVKLRKDFGA